MGPIDAGGDAVSVFSRPRERVIDEQMDAVDADRDHLERSLRYLTSINRWLGYASGVSRAVLSLCDDRELTVVDVGSGAGDVAGRLIDLAQRQGREANVVGVDLHESTVRFARRTSHRQATFVRGDALRLPLGDRSVDIAMASLFLHHLDNEAAVRVLQEMQRVAKHGIVVADLVRCRRAYGWAKLLSCFANPMVRHDALVSVRQGFKRDELLELAGRTELENVTIATTFGHRLLLTARS